MRVVHGWNTGHVLCSHVSACNFNGYFNYVGNDVSKALCKRVCMFVYPSTWLSYLEKPVCLSKSCHLSGNDLGSKLQCLIRGFSTTLVKYCCFGYEKNTFQKIKIVLRILYITTISLTICTTPSMAMY